MAEALRRANTLHTQRVGHPAVLQSRFAPTGDIGGSPAFSWEGPLHSLDLLPPGHFLSAQESSAVDSKDVDPLPTKFLPGQATESVLKVTKRPKLRAKDVAHRKSLTAADVPTGHGTPRFWNLDSSIVSAGGHVDHAASAPGGYFHTPPTAVGPGTTTLERVPVTDLPRTFHPTNWAHGGPGSGTIMATLLFGSRGVLVPVEPEMLVRELRLYAARLAELDAATVQLFWSNTMLDPEGDLTHLLSWPVPQSVVIEVRVVNLSSAPVPQHSPPGSSSSLADSEYGPFSVTLVFEDGNFLSQPTWPAVTIQVLRRQITTTFQRNADTIVLVCCGTILAPGRRLSDPPAITNSTRIFVFFSHHRALQYVGMMSGGDPPSVPPLPSPVAPAPPRPSFGPELPPGFSRGGPATHSPQGPSPNTLAVRGGTNDKLRATFKCPKFLGDPRHWKQWNKGLIRFMAIQQLDYVIDADFKSFALSVVQQEDNKLVYYLLEDAVSGSPVATKYVRRAPEWDGHAAYNYLYDGYSFSGPATATLLLSELANFRFNVDESV